LTRSFRRSWSSSWDWWSGRTRRSASAWIRSICQFLTRDRLRPFKNLCCRCQWSFALLFCPRFWIGNWSGRIPSSLVHRTYFLQEAVHSLHKMEKSGHEEALANIIIMYKISEFRTFWYFTCRAIIPALQIHSEIFPIVMRSYWECS
jgi:hypothetical protein